MEKVLHRLYCIYVYKWNVNTFCRTFREDYFRPSHTLTVLHGFRNVVSFNRIAWNYYKAEPFSVGILFYFILFLSVSLREMRSQTKKVMRHWLSASQAVCIKCWEMKNCGNFSRHLSNFRILLKQCSNRTSDSSSSSSQHHFEKREKNESHGCVAIVNVRFDVAFCLWKLDAVCRCEPR